MSLNYLNMSVPNRLQPGLSTPNFNKELSELLNKFTWEYNDYVLKYFIYIVRIKKDYFPILSLSEPYSYSSFTKYITKL